MEKVLIVILNWNNTEETYKCIISILSQSFAVFDILVIDNCSKIDPKKKLKANFPNIYFIRNKKNLGVADGRNVGVRFALENGYKYLLFIDNDAHLEKNMLKFLYRSAKENKNHALFGPKIFIDQLENIIYNAGCTSWKWTYLHAGNEIIYRFCKLFNREIPNFLDTRRGFYKKDCQFYNKEKDVSFIIGCAQLIKTKIFYEIGMLDSDFSPYGSEDIDFCSRITKNNWKIRYVPDAICWHREESSFSNSYERSYYNTRNIILLARKNLSPIYFSLLFIYDFFIFTTPLMFIECIIKKRKNKLYGFINGIIWNYHDIKNRGIMLRKKK